MRLVPQIVSKPSTLSPFMEEHLAELRSGHPRQDRRRPSPSLPDEQPAAPPKDTLARREGLSRRSLAVADVLSAALALYLAVSVLGDDRFTSIAIFALPLVVVVAKIKGLYDRDAQVLHKTTLDEAPALFQLATLYTLLLAMGDDVLLQGQLGNDQLLGVWGILFGVSVGGRTVARRLVREMIEPERCLVIGDFKDALRIANKLHGRPSLGAVVVGRVAPEDEAGPDHGDRLGDLHQLRQIVEMHRIHRLIVAPHGIDSDRLLDTIRMAKSLGVQVSVLPRLLEVIGSSVEFDHVDGMSIMGIRRFGLTRSSSAVKRAMDAVGAALLVVVLFPLLLAIGLAVKLTSPGPVLFRQTRIGQDGEPFTMYKFRSMAADAEARKQELLAHNEAPDGLFKIQQDPRITRFGGLLRRGSLDELPQLFNVLLGHMSLVGPRPLVPDEDRRIEGTHRRRMHLKPGMTGHWQILGSSRIPMAEMVNIDYLYVANWSLWGDLKILMRTIPYMLSRRGA